jgi:hypothetical protein
MSRLILSKFKPMVLALIIKGVLDYMATIYLKTCAESII